MSGTPGSTSLKITIKRPPTAPLVPSPSTEAPPQEQKKRKRSAEDSGDGDESTPPLKRSSRDGEPEGKRRARRKSALRELEWTPSPPGAKSGGKEKEKDRSSPSKGKRRKNVYEEDGDYDPDRKSPAAEDMLVDIEDTGEGSPLVKKKSAAGGAGNGRPKRKSKPSAKAAMVLSDEEDDYDTPPPTPPRNTKPKGRGRRSEANVTITARDQRKMPVENGSLGEAAPVAGGSTNNGVAPAAGSTSSSVPVEPPKPKLPPIKKKSMLPGAAPGTPGVNGTPFPAPAVKEEMRTPASTTKANDMYNQLFNSGGSTRIQKERQRQEARYLELERMRQRARTQREIESRTRFDMLAQSSAMNRFEANLRERRNWPSPSQIGSCFLMLRRYRSDL